MDRVGCVLPLLFAALLFHVTTGQQGVPGVDRVRLVDGNATAGRVEVQINNVWGTVCDDNWDNLDAGVVCKTLGLTGGVALKNAIPYGEGTGAILMDDVFCAGNENSLGECNFVTGQDVNCQHSEDAGVVCQPAGAGQPATTTTTTPRPGVTQSDNCNSGSNQQARVQLYGPEPGIGYVLVRAPNGTVGYVCDDGWDTNAAKVVCAELCYDTSVSEPGLKKDKQVSVSNPIFALDDVRCAGRESSVADCQHLPWFSHNCQPSELAAVTCVTVSYPIPPPPKPILQCRNGDLIALFNKSRDPNLEPKHLSVFNLTGTCNGFVVDATDPQYISARIPFEGPSCNTKVQQNETHIIYSNTIFMESTSREGDISRVNDYRIELTCEMPRDALVDTDVQPLTETVTQKTEGQFVIAMKLYEDQQFSQETVSYPYRLDLGNWVNAAVELESIDSRLKLIVNSCTAKANLTNTAAPTMPLLVDKCVEERSTLDVYPLSQIKFGLRFQSFVFVHYPFLVLECDAIVCLTSEVTSECDRSCNNSKPAPSPSGRRRREADWMKTVYRVSSQPIVVQFKQITSSTVPPSTATPKPASSTVTTSSTETSTRRPTTATTRRPATSTRRPTTATSTHKPTTATSTRRPTTATSTRKLTTATSTRRPTTATSTRKPTTATSTRKPTTATSTRRPTTVTTSSTATSTHESATVISVKGTGSPTTARPAIPGPPSPTTTPPTQNSLQRDYIVVLGSTAIVPTLAFPALLLSLTFTALTLPALTLPTLL